MLGVTASQAFRMKLHTQKKRQPMPRVRFQFQRLHHPIGTAGDNRQHSSGPIHSLVVRAVYAQGTSRRYLGEHRFGCQMHIVDFLRLAIHLAMP
jgi:hypothetical protein